jgi:hypothetical protein
MAVCGLRSGSSSAGWRGARGIREKGLVAAPGETSPGHVEQRPKNQPPRLTRFANGRGALSAGGQGGEVVNEPVEILAGDQLTPRPDNAWSSRERCDRVTSSTRESPRRREASRWRRYDEADEEQRGVRRTTMRKRLTAKLHGVKAELQRRMHQPVTEQGRWLQSVVKGYFAYHAIPGNWKALGAFRTQCIRLWYRALRRRSQKSRLTWERMAQIADAWLPHARILHPWPEQRLAALIRGKSRMR